MKTARIVALFALAASVASAAPDRRCDATAACSLTEDAARVASAWSVEHGAGLRVAHLAAASSGRHGGAAPSWAPLAAAPTVADGPDDAPRSFPRAAHAGRGVQVAQLSGADALAATPESLDGLLALRQSVIDAQTRGGGAAADAVAAATAREAEIAAILAARDPAPIDLPSCADLVAWGATLEPQNSRRTRAGIVVTGLEAPELATLFGKTFDRWDAADIDAMGKLAAQCREAGRAGLLGGEPRKMMRAGQNVVILHAQTGNQPPIFAALAASRDAADAIVAEADATPPGLDGLAALGALRQRAASVDEADAARAVAAIEARRATLVAAEISRIEAELLAAPANREGLTAALEAGAAAERGALGVHLSDAERAALRAAAAAAADRIAPAALPDLQSLLAALPETEVRAAAIGAAIVLAGLPAFEAELAALPETAESLAYALTVGAQADAETRPGFAAYAGAAAARATALRDAMAAARCAPAVAGLSDSDAARPVLLGTETGTLGRLLCAFDADSSPTYEAPGFFGSRHTVEATVMGGHAVKVVLIEGDAPGGGKALIGERIEDGSGARDVSVAEWQGWSGALAGGSGACAFMAEGFADAMAQGWDADALVGDLARCLIAHPDAPIPIGG